jgi:hypothetical protein
VSCIGYDYTHSVGYSVMQEKEYDYTHAV